jgi:uncharacterized protein YbdZ (MbtH family)
MSWHDPDKEDTTIYKVVVNHEEQYSIWPADRENPLGWNDVGKSGLKAECLAYIKEVWTDMRPLSLRKKMAEAALEAKPEQNDAHTPAAPPEESLVERLSKGDHPVEASIRPIRTVESLKECIDRGYIHIKFPNTRGGTELGVRLDPNAINLSQADFNSRSGTIHLEGDLTLDYEKVRCIADIDLQTLSGEGRLERVQSAG